MTRPNFNRQPSTPDETSLSSAKLTRQARAESLPSFGSALGKVQRGGQMRKLDMAELQEALTNTCSFQSSARAVSNAALMGSLQLEDLRALLQAPSTWAGRTTLGFRGKQNSKKTKQERVIAGASPYTHQLRRRWQEILKQDNGKKLKELQQEGGAFERQCQFEDAADNYFEAIGWAREMYGETATLDFVSLVRSYLRCCKELRVSASAEEHEEYALRFLIKMMNFASPSYVALPVGEPARSAAQDVFDEAMGDGYCLRLVVRVASRINGDQTLSDDAARHCLQLWSWFLSETSRVEALSPAAYSAAVTANKQLLELRATHCVDVPKFVMPPRRTGDGLNAELFVNVQASRYVSGRCPPLDDFCRFVKSRRGRPAGQASCSKKSAAVLLLGPTGSGKTELAKCVANYLGVEMIKVRAVDVKTKWVGESEKTLRSMFEGAKKRASASQSSNFVVLFDELDGLAKSRSTDDTEHGTAQGGDRDILTLLLGAVGPAELEYTYVKDGREILGELVVVGTTNRSQDLDKALLSRFPTRILLPRWTPAQNMSLLAELTRNGTSSESGIQVGFAQMLAGSLPKEGEIPLFGDQLSALMGMRLVTTMLASRLQLRDIYAAAESALLVGNSSQSRSAGDNAWTLASELLKRRQGLGPCGDLIANSFYEVCELRQLGPGSESVVGGPRLTAFRVSLDGLMQPDAASLDLDVHPYLAPFSIKTKSCALVLTGEGVGMTVLSNSETPAESYMLKMFGCFSGAKPVENRNYVLQQLISSGSRFGCRACFALDSMGKLRYRLFENELNQYPDLPEQCWFLDKSKDRSSSLTMSFAKWGEVVAGARSFHDAKNQLVSFRRSSREVSLELFVEEF